MASNISGFQIDPSEFADSLVRQVIPTLLERGYQDGISRDLADQRNVLGDARGVFARSSPEEHTQALLRATRALAPPSNVPGGDQTYAVLVGMVALRASTPDLLFQHSLDQRYEVAASWVCENFGVIIWWNCD